MISYQIQTDVPVPAPLTPRDRMEKARLARKPKAPKYPLAELAMGASFVVPHAEGKTLRSTASQYAKKTGAKFLTRTFEDGVRIWRVA